MKPISVFFSAALLSIALATACSREQEQDVFYEEDLMDAPVAIRFGAGMPRIAATKILGPIDDWNPAQDLYIYGIAREGLNSQATADAPLDLTTSGILINNVKAESAPAPNGNPSEIREYITVYSNPAQQIPFFYAPDRRYEFFGYYVDDAVANPAPTVGDDSITLPIVIDGSQDIMVASTDKEADKALATQEVSLDRLYSAISSRRGVVPNLVFQHQLSRFNVQVRNGSSSQTASNYKLAYIRIQSDTEGTLVIAKKQEKAPGGIVDTSNPQYLDLVRNGHVFSADDNFVPIDELIEVGDVMVIPGGAVYKMKIGLSQMGYTADGVPAEAEYDIDLSALLDDAEAKAEPGYKYNVKIVIYGLEEIKVSVSLAAWELGGEVLVDPDGDGQYVPVTSLEVSPASLTLDPGDTETLTVTVNPSDATFRTVSWHSSNTAVATVSHGQVTAVGAGEAIITASAGGQSASCEVTVNNTEGGVSPLKFTSTGSTSIALIRVGNPDPITLEYKVDNGEWESYTVGDEVALTDGQSVSFRAGEGGNSSFSKSSTDYYQFTVSGSGTFAASGDIMSLLNKDGGLTIPTSYCFRGLFYNCSKLTNAPELPATTLASSCYSGMFNGCTGLTTAPDLPATTLASSCYSGMFSGCTGLTTAPDLPATALASWCYQSMFEGCTGLATAPELPASNLTTGCYTNMFLGCTGLSTAPELPATTLAGYCYESMFRECTGLTIASELPATTLANRCYYMMFYDCSSLTTAPELPATTLTEYCYGHMFFRCTSLTAAPELPATALANYCYSSMFYGCIGLTTAPELPATTMAESCYSSMFVSCTGLTTAPELPATALANECYSAMFYGCTGLTTAPELPATTLVNRCYYEMFASCTGLTSAPELPATTLAENCYYEMFYLCRALTSAPELPATALANYCYRRMFYCCSGLTAAPELPATTLAEGCYESLFDGCSNLSYIKALFTTEPSSSYTKHWLSGVAETGTFVKSSSATWVVAGVNGVPEGWTVITDSQVPEAVDLGLPSGLKWASFNLGASAPEEYGDYYAWGEIEPYYISLDPLTWKNGKSAGYDWPSYRWCYGSSWPMTKYNSEEKTVLEFADDVAHVRLGGNWRMPTDGECTELREQCTWEWTTQSGVNGLKVTGLNGNSLFLPAAGYWYDFYFDNAGSCGYYWSSSLNNGYKGSAWNISLYSDHVDRGNFHRCFGLSVRPVTE